MIEITDAEYELFTQLSWNLLGDWLWDLETEEVVGYYRLIEMFEQQTRHKIEWVKESD